MGCFNRILGQNAETIEEEQGRFIHSQTVLYKISKQRKHTIEASEEIKEGQC